MHYVYLMESTAGSGKRYVGYTNELRQRIKDHNSGKNVSTAPYRPWQLKTYLAFSNKAQALAFERYLKSGPDTRSRTNACGKFPSPHISPSPHEPKVLAFE